MTIPYLIYKRLDTAHYLWHHGEFHPVCLQCAELEWSSQNISLHFVHVQVMCG